MRDFATPMAKRRRTGSFTKTVAKVNAAVMRSQPNPPKRDLSFPSGIQTFRFYATSAKTQSAVSCGQLLSILGVQTSANTLSRIIHSMKIRSVEMWSPPAAGSGSLGIQWAGTTSGDRVLDDINVANTASYIKSRPPRGSDSSDWLLESINESTTQFRMTCPAGAVMDIHCMVTAVSNASDGHSTTTTTAAGTAGVYYFNALDGTGATVIPVTALNTIA